MPVDIDYAEEPGKRLGNDRPQGRPQNPQAEGQHQHQVQNDVHHRGRRQEQQGAPAVPQAPQDAGIEIVANAADEAGADHH